MYIFKRNIFCSFLGTNIKSTTLENNAEVSPGYPAAFSIIHVPLKCPDGKKIVGYRCRTIYEN